MCTVNRNKLSKSYRADKNDKWLAMLSYTIQKNSDPTGKKTELHKTGHISIAIMQYGQHSIDWIWQHT